MPFDVNDLHESWGYLPMEARQAIVTLLTLCLTWLSKKVSSLTIKRLCPGVYSAIKFTVKFPFRCFVSTPPCPLTQTLLDGLAVKDATIAFMPPRSDKHRVGPAGEVLLLDTFVVQLADEQNQHKDAVYVDDQNVLPRVTHKHRTLIMARARSRHGAIKEKADQVSLDALIHKAKGADARLYNVNINVPSAKPTNKGA